MAAVMSREEALKIGREIFECDLEFVYYTDEKMAYDQAKAMSILLDRSYVTEKIVMRNRSAPLSGPEVRWYIKVKPFKVKP